MNINLKKDIEGIKTIHKKCIKVISSCEHIVHINSASTYFELAQTQFKNLYPNVPGYKNHNILLDKVIKHIDIFLSLKRMQLRSRK